MKDSSKTSKSIITEELQELRQKGLAKSHRGKYKDSDKFRTPEEAQAYLTTVRTIKNKHEKPTPPANLKAADLNDWYAQQRQRELAERKNREEAEAFIRGYRSKLNHVIIPTSPSRGGNDSIHEGSVVFEEGAQVSAEVEKLEKSIDEVNLDGDDMEDVEDDGNTDAEIESSGSDNDNDLGATEVEECKEEKVQEPIAKEQEVEEDKIREESNDNHVEEEISQGDNAEEPATEQEVGENDEGEESNDGNEEVIPETKVEDLESATNKQEVEENVGGEESNDRNEDAKVENVDSTNPDIESELKEDHTTTENDNDEVTISTEDPVTENLTDNKEEELDAEEKKEDRTEIETELTPVTNGENGWRFLISREPGSKFAPEPNRYHLYVAYACPWAHRTVIVRNLKGLEDVIGMTYVHPTWQFTSKHVDEHRGWVFGEKGGKNLSNTSGIGSFPSNWGDEDPLMGAKSIREIYLKVNDTTGKYILPILWDKKFQTIVSNESSEIIRMLNSEFDEFAKNPELNLYPSDLAKEIDEVNKWVYPTFNNGVYRCGLSSTQNAYDEAIDELTASFDKIDAILQKQRYLVGDSITEADVRLFVTLFRFDEVYDVYFKCNTRCVARTPALLNYVRDIYQMSGVTETCRMNMIKAHYYTSHVELNKYSIIPRGDNFQGLLDQPHNRDSM